MSLSDKALRQFVGIPYKIGGEDFKGADCYGIIKMFYNKAFNLDLKIKRSKNPLEKNSIEISELFYQPENKLDFKFGDILTFLITLKDNTKSFHSGVVIEKNLMLHSDNPTGSSLQRFNNYFHKTDLRHNFRLKYER